MANQVIILTGASRGIGLAIARHLLSTTTANLVLTSRTTTSLTSLATTHDASRIEIVAGNASDPELPSKLVTAALTRWGRLDSLIVNHGSLDPVCKVADSSPAAWREAFDINVFSAVGMVQAALPELRKSQGRIVLTSSGAATSAYQGWGAYGSGKAVLNHLALTLGSEEPEVTTVSIRPGVVDTEMQREIREVHHEAMSASDQEKFHGLKSGGGLLTPEQPGHVIAKLAVKAGKELSGKFLSWDDACLGEFQE